MTDAKAATGAFGDGDERAGGVDQSHMKCPACREAHP